MRQAGRELRVVLLVESAPGSARYVVWSHGPIVSALSASAFGEPWPWTSLVDLARKQNQRIDAVLTR